MENVELSDLGSDSHSVNNDTCPPPLEEAAMTTECTENSIEENNTENVKEVLVVESTTSQSWKTLLL